MFHIHPAVGLALFLATLDLKPTQDPEKAAGKILPPRVFLSDGKDLVLVKEKFKAGDPRVVADVKKLRASADKALKFAPVSVVHPKPIKPPSGDKHDYMSLSRYAWPNPKTKNGLPYILKDGQVNPEQDKYDEPLLSRMLSNVRTLALAYFLTDDEKYAIHAAKLLRVWFLDKATRMNPNMNFAGFVPGKDQGRGQGLTDAVALTLLVDAVGMIRDSPPWTPADRKGMETWYRQFLDWMRTSDLGKAEGKTLNNHASWYDVGVATYALFVADAATAKTVLGDAKSRRIAKQILPDGEQPLELKRTHSFNYSVYNLQALFDLATLGDHAGVDLWQFQTKDGRGIRKAFDFMVPYAAGKKKWPYPQTTKIPYADMVPLLRRAANAYADKKYEAIIPSVPGAAGALELTDLVYPAR
jgi:hypothetical protein